MRRGYLAIAGFAAVLAFASSQLAADVVVEEHIKDVDACGLVMDHTGHGIEGAIVSAKRGENVLATASTLSDGSFNFEQSVNTPIQLNVQAKGFVTATGSVERMESAGSFRKCRRPLYAVLGVGGGSSYLTAKKKSLPRSR